MARAKRTRGQRPRSRGKSSKPASDKRTFEAVVVRETGKAILLRLKVPAGEFEIWQPRAAVEPLPDGRWLISESALVVKVHKAEEESKVAAAFGKDYLPVEGGEIIGSTDKAYKVKLLIAWGTAEPVAWRGFVPMTQASLIDGRLCLSRWIISQKQDELFAQGMPGPQGGGGRIVADEHKPRPVIEIDSAALAAVIRGDRGRPSETPRRQPETPAKAAGEPGRLF